MNDLTIKLKDISVSFGNKDIFDIDELSAYVNDRIAIVGKNGSGKSTLLKLLAGELEEYSGQVQKENEFNYFKQIEESTYKSDNDMDFEMLSRLNVPDNEGMSGGEQTKFRIVKALSNYQLGLLLDEPTTHLDKESIDYLIEELRYYYGTLIFVSHDRYFINQLASKIWEISDGSIREFNGNYDDYIEAKEKEELEQAYEHEKMIKEKERLQASIEEKSAKAEKLAGKAKGNDIKPSRLASSKQKDTVQKQAFKAVKATESRLSQLKETSSPLATKEVQFPMSKDLEMHNKFPIMGRDVSVTRGEKLLLDQVSFQFPLGSTIAITGSNGSGKSSFLNDLINEKEGFELSPKVKFGFYKQMDYKLQGDSSVLDFLLNQSKLSADRIRAVLINLGFTIDETLKPVNKLSGGEATKVSLALMFVEPSNVIIMDEPTNFIDINTIEALEKFIDAYTGTIILTSHDKYFVNRVADYVYKIENQNLVEVR